jgi:hypothetical protein
VSQFSDLVDWISQILAFNGTPVRNLKHLAKMVESCEEQFLRFDLEYQQVLTFTQISKSPIPGCCLILL